MVSKDFIGPIKKIKKSAVISLTGIINSLKDYVVEKGYSIIEKNYNEKELQDGITKTDFTWECEKKIEEFTKAIIDINFNSETKDVIIKKENMTIKAQEGDFEISFQGYLKKDIETEWKLSKKAPWRRVIREMYDKFVMKEKFAGYEQILEEDIRGLISQTKSYFDVKGIR